MLPFRRPDRDDAPELGRYDNDAAAFEDVERRVLRRPADPMAEPCEVAPGAGATDVELARAVLRQREDRRELALGQPPRSRAQVHAHAPRERGAHLQKRRLKVGGRDARRVDAHGKVDLPAAVKPGECVDERVPGRLAVEHAAGAACDHRRLEPAQDDRGVTVRRVDYAAHAPELVVERTLGGTRRGRDIRAEDANADPAQAAEGA